MRLFSLTMNAVNQGGVLDTSYNGNVTITVGRAAVIGTTTVKAVNGVAILRAGEQVRRVLTLHVSGAVDEGSPLAVTPDFDAHGVDHAAVGTYSHLNSKIVVTFSQPLAASRRRSDRRRLCQQPIRGLPRSARPGGVFVAPGHRCREHAIHATLTIT